MNHVNKNTPPSTTPINNPVNSPPITNPSNTTNAEPFLEPSVAESTARNETEREPLLLRPVAESTISNRDPPITPMPTAAEPTGATGHAAAGQVPFPPPPPPELPAWANMSEFHFLQGRPPSQPVHHPTITENAISTLDPIRSQVVGDFHQASQWLETPVSDRGIGSSRAPAFNHPHVRSLHHQHNTMVALQELRSRSQPQSQTSCFHSR